MEAADGGIGDGWARRLHSGWHCISPGCQLLKLPVRDVSLQEEPATPQPCPASLAHRQQPPFSCRAFFFFSDRCGFFAVSLCRTKAPAVPRPPPQMLLLPGHWEAATWLQSRALTGPGSCRPSAFLARPRGLCQGTGWLRGLGCAPAAAAAAAAWHGAGDPHRTAVPPREAPLWPDPLRGAGSVGPHVPVSELEIPKQGEDEAQGHSSPVPRALTSMLQSCTRRLPSSMGQLPGVQPSHTPFWGQDRTLLP